MVYSKKLPLMLGCLLMASVAASLMCVYQLNRLSDNYAETVQRSSLLIQQVADVQNHFKTQVQEWKNVLLRGKDPVRLTKYWGAFQTQEKKVAKGVGGLMHSVSNPETQKILRDFAAQHELMGEGYRNGFADFAASGYSPFEGDAAVKGVDRPAGVLLAQLIKVVSEQSEVQVTQAADLRDSTTKKGVVLLVVVSLVSFVFAVLIARNVIAQFGGEPDEVKTLVREISKGGGGWTRKFRSSRVTNPVFWRQ